MVHAAVGDKGGSVKMVNRHGWDNWDVTEMTDVDDDAPGDVVRQVRLDDLVDDDILLLKIDAEGAEDLVMRSALRILEGRKIDSILLEAKGSSDDARNEFKKGVFKGLVEKGYTAYEFYEEVEPCSQTLACDIWCRLVELCFRGTCMTICFLSK